MYTCICLHVRPGVVKWSVSSENAQTLNYGDNQRFIQQPNSCTEAGVLYVTRFVRVPLWLDGHTQINEYFNSECTRSIDKFNCEHVKYKD